MNMTRSTLWWKNFRDEEHAHFGLTYPVAESGKPFLCPLERLEALEYNAVKFPNIDLVQDIERQRQLIAGRVAA